MSKHDNAYCTSCPVLYEEKEANPLCNFVYVTLVQVAQKPKTMSKNPVNCETLGTSGDGCIQYLGSEDNT